MAIYSKAALELLVEMLNRDNPDLPFQLNSTDYIYGVPTARTPVAPDYRDTSITVTPKRSAPYIGAVSLTYRRINLGSLFSGIKISLTRYQVPNVGITFSTLLPLFNEKYGMNLTMADVVDRTWGTANGGFSGTAQAIAAQATSLFCTGSMSVYWYQGKQIIGQDILTVTEVNGRLWPNGNNMTVDRTKTAEFLLADQDFTEIASQFVSVGNSGSVANTGPWQTIFAKVKDFTGVQFSIVDSSGGINGKAFLSNIVLPNAAYPDLSRPGFNRACRIDLTAAGLSHGYQGYMTFYYNV